MPLPEFDVVRVETTYADLRPTDRIVAQDGTVWPIADLGIGSNGAMISFWLSDPVSRVKMHNMTKARNDSVTVERIPTHAEDVAKAEAEFPEPGQRVEPGEVIGRIGSTGNSIGLHLQLGAAVTAEVTAEDVAKAGAEFLTGEDGPIYLAEETSGYGVELLSQELGAVVTAEVTAEEVDQAKEAAATDTPIEILAFAEMTPLEQRSHLYLLHGVFAYDLQSRDELVATHEQAHADHAAGKLNSRQIPHTHGVPK
jgi:hypothetical protein